MIDARVAVDFYCANAFDNSIDSLSSCYLLCEGNTTVFFWYLIPRGLKEIKPLLLRPSLATSGALAEQETKTTASSSKGDSFHGDSSGNEETTTENAINSSAIRNNNHPNSRRRTIHVVTYILPFPDEDGPLYEARIPAAASTQCRMASILLSISCLRDYVVV